MTELDALLDDLVDEYGVTVSDATAPRAGEHHVDVDPNAPLPAHVPEAVRAVLEYPPSNVDRSAVFFLQVKTAIEWGASDEEAILVGRHSAHGRAKYGDQVDVEAERVIAKVKDRRGIARGGVSSLSSLTSQADTHPTLDAAAYYGLAGDVVRALDPHTEADPAGVLVSFLAAFGTIVGPGPHALASSARHPARIYPVLVGRTAGGRKGSAWSTTRFFLNMVDARFMETRVMGGFGSGESVVDEVMDPDKDDAPPTDKRLLVYEPEFARLLRVAARDGSTLSPLLRAAWDGEQLAVRSRAKKAVANGGHVVVVGHVTADELRKHLAEVEVANGFANRFMFVSVRRSKLLPEGGDLQEEDLALLASHVRHVWREASSYGLVQRDAPARELWAELYQRIAESDRDGLVGAVTARADATVLRLSVAYALLDSSRTIRPPHLEAAWALWRYAEASAEYVFGNALGDPVADRLLAAITAAGDDGLDATEQHAALGRHVSAKQLNEARSALEHRGLIETEKHETGGRPRVVSCLAKKAKQAKEGPA